MRLISAACTLLALAAAGQAGHLLWQETRAPARLPAAAANAVPEPLAQPAPAAAPPRSWAPLFGEKQPPRPQAAAPAPAAAAAAPPKPPLASLGYALQGVVQAGETTWAMISHPAGAQLLRAGDRLPGGITVERIDSRGLWLSRSGGAPELLDFPQ